MKIVICSVVILVTYFYACMTVISAKRLNIYALDERWACNIKKTCSECLRLNQCSWCKSENRCFSKNLSIYDGFCSEDEILYTNYGFSLEENALCSCAGGSTDAHCYPPGVIEDFECSGRGTCVCGRCLCDVNPDIEHPTKAVMGRYCEFDNFSCDGPKCNEGPYLVESLSHTSYFDMDGFSSVDNNKETVE